MSWTTLTPDDLSTYLAAPQVKALQTKALASGQSDPVAAIIEDVATRVRAELRASGRIVLSATEGTLPPELRRTVLALVIEAAQTRLPGLALTPEQKRAADQARDILALAIAGKLTLSAPDDPETTQAATQVAQSRTNPLTSQDLKGL